MPCDDKRHRAARTRLETQGLRDSSDQRFFSRGRSGRRTAGGEDRLLRRRSKLRAAAACADRGQSHTSPITLLFERGHHVAKSDVVHPDMSPDRTVGLINHLELRGLAGQRCDIPFRFTHDTATRSGGGSNRFSVHQQAHRSLRAPTAADEKRDEVALDGERLAGQLAFRSVAF